MTEQEVVDLLGEPVERQSSEPPAGVKQQWLVNGEHVPRFSYGWKYGELRYTSDAFPFAFDYEVYFCEGRVEDIYDPFERCTRRTVGQRCRNC